jgi:DNA invertase Pin-like site-specific DNA recombinase
LSIAFALSNSCRGTRVRTRGTSGGGKHIGRPKALDPKKADLAQRMHASGESASTIASTAGVNRATVYRVLAERDGDE